jgi:hypothetical protein
MYIGRLTKREQRELQERFEVMFVKPTERFYLFLLCETCLPLALLPVKVTQVLQRNELPYEIISVNENA